MQRTEGDEGGLGEGLRAGDGTHCALCRRGARGRHAICTASAGQKKNHPVRCSTQTVERGGCWWVVLVAGQVAEQQPERAGEWRWVPSRPAVFRSIALCDHSCGGQACWWVACQRLLRVLGALACVGQCGRRISVRAHAPKQRRKGGMKKKWPEVDQAAVTIEPQQLSHSKSAKQGREGVCVQTRAGLHNSRRPSLSLERVRTCSAEIMWCTCMPPAPPCHYRPSHWVRESIVLCLPKQNTAARLGAVMAWAVRAGYRSP